MKDFLKKKYIYIILATLIIISAILGGYLYKEKKKNITVMENQYNFALYELINYIQDVENYLAKAMISSTPKQGIENLTEVWREANLAQVYLSQLPVSNNELAGTAKFLNQVSEYSYALSRKNINGENLTQEDLDNINELHNYSMELKNTLNQLCTDMSERKNKLERIN